MEVEPISGTWSGCQYLWKAPHWTGRSALVALDGVICDDGNSGVTYLWELVQGAMAADPDERPSSARELSYALECLEGASRRAAR